LKFRNLHSLSYIYSVALKTHATGVPMMRPLFIEFPNDPAVWHVDTQYMLGPSLLVAPVYTASGEVQYYVPAGDWVGLLDEKVRKGPGYFVETHGFDSIPLLLRPGTAIVMNSRENRPVYDYAGDVVVLVNPFTDHPMHEKITISNSANPKEIVAELIVSGVANEVEIEASGLSSAWKVRVFSGGGVREKTAEKDTLKLKV
jgi:alpha-D-xyloside xylohydrolase